MDLKRLTIPILLHLMKGRVRFPRLFLLRCKLTLGPLKSRLRDRFPADLIEQCALPVWVYLELKRAIGQPKAYEIMRVALLVGGTAMQNFQFRTVDRERTFDAFCDAELENSRSGLVRWNKVEVVERSARRFEMRVTRCLFHELAVAAGAPELTPVVCQVDNAFFNSYLPDVMTFHRPRAGRRIADGAKECGFIWELRQP